MPKYVNTVLMLCHENSLFLGELLDISYGTRANTLEMGWHKEVRRVRAS